MLRAAMVLAAGLGTRLRPLTDRIAKPMVPVGDAPAIAHVFARVGDVGTRVVNVHHRPEDVEAWARAEGVLVSREAELLGTAGGVARARGLLGGGDVLVWNGDILCELDAGTLAAAHAASRGAATLAVAARPAGEGNVGIGRDGRVVRLRRESFGVEIRSADFIGIQVLGEELREALPERGCLVGDCYIPALARGAPLSACFVETPFLDVGTLGAYVAANRAWLARRGLTSWAAPDSEHHASIEGSIVGSGARIDAPAIGCIVWPGTRVTAAVRDAIVTPDVVVSYDRAR